VKEALLKDSVVHPSDYNSNSRDFSVAAQGRIFVVRKKQLIPQSQNDLKIRNKNNSLKNKQVTDWLFVKRTRKNRAIFQVLFWKYCAMHNE
jgi:hypothetical protein